MKKANLSNPFMVNISPLLVAFVIISLLTFNSCKHDPALPPAYNSNNYSTDNNCDSDSVYFANNVLPLIVSSCAKSGCHDRSTHENNIVLTDYNSIIVTGKIKKFDPYGSEFYEVIKEGEMPPGSPFNQNQVDLIFKWIAQGAQNNHCTSCDSAVTSTYAAFVEPLMQAKCIGCHNGSQAGGNINLSTYQGVRTIALNGQLVGALAGNGYKLMPYNSAPLPTCEIDKVTEWVNNGALNN